MIPSSNPHQYLSGNANNSIVDIIYLSMYFPKREFFSGSRFANCTNNKEMTSEGTKKVIRNQNILCSHAK